MHDKTGIQHNCSFCAKTFQTETSLNTHKTNYHCKIEQMGEYVHCQIIELSRQFASINNTDKIENFGHFMHNIYKNIIL